MPNPQGPSDPGQKIFSEAEIKRNRRDYALFMIFSSVLKINTLEIDGKSPELTVPVVVRILGRLIKFLEWEKIEGNTFLRRLLEMGNDINTRSEQRAEQGKLSRRKVLGYIYPMVGWAALGVSIETITEIIQNSKRKTGKKIEANMKTFLAGLAGTLLGVKWKDFTSQNPEIFEVKEKDLDDEEVIYLNPVEKTEKPPNNIAEETDGIINDYWDLLNLVEYYNDKNLKSKIEIKNLVEFAQMFLDNQDNESFDLKLKYLKFPDVGVSVNLDAPDKSESRDRQN